jgi:hypothetical protein
MPYVFWVFLAASLVHIGEEYFFPGGFVQIMQKLNPRWAPAITVPFTVTVNLLFILLVLVGAIVGETSLVFSLSIAALLFLNGIAHLVGTIFTRHYVPGLISGLILYIPLSITAFHTYVCSGRVDLESILFSILLGIAYQLIPLILIATASRTA